MNNKIFKILGSVLLVSMVSFGCVLLVNYTNSKKYAWINLTKVYNDFAFKKELESKLKIVQGERKKILDSLELNLKILANRIESSKKPTDDKVYEFQTKKQDYFDKKQQFDEDNTQLQSDYNQQVLTQINQYVKDFALKNKWDMIFGADGTGAIMFANENIEVTEEVTGFINNKYKGIN